MEEIAMLRPKEVVCRWVDAFNAHDVSGIAALYHDEAVNHQVANEPVAGIAAIREMFAAEFAAADMTAIVEIIFRGRTVGDSGVAGPSGVAGLRVLSRGPREDSVSAGLLGQAHVSEAAQPAG